MRGGYDNRSVMKTVICILLIIVILGFSGYALVSLMVSDAPLPPIFLGEEQTEVDTSVDIPSATELPTFDTAKGSDITPPEPDTYQESNMPSLETEQTKEPDTSSPETEHTKEPDTISPETEHTKEPDTSSHESEYTKESDTASPEPEMTPEPETTPPTPTVCTHEETLEISLTKPTCVKAGRSKVLCIKCAATLTADLEIPPLGHSFVSYKCSTCGTKNRCPDPVLDQSDAAEIRRGTSFALSWGFLSTPAEDVEYFLYVYDGDYEAGAGSAVFDEWLCGTTTTVNASLFPHVGRYYVEVHTRYKGDASNNSQCKTADYVELVVVEAGRLTSPLLLTPDGQHLCSYEGLILDWEPIEATYADVLYSIYLRRAGKLDTQICLAITEGTIFPVPGEYFSESGIYELCLVASDRNQLYADSEEAVITVYVNIEVVEDPIDYTDQELYINDYFYNYIGTLEKGSSMQSFYRALDRVISGFHDDEAANAKTVRLNGTQVYHYAGTVNVNQHGLTFDEATSVLWLYTQDHPLYYWISRLRIMKGNDMYIIVFDEYIDGDVRAAYNATIYEGVERITQNVEDEDSTYYIAMAYYEILVKGVDYSYDAVSNAENDDYNWAFSILGFFDNGKGVVCEGFAETYSLLLNFSNIDNLIVTGYTAAGEPHGWNLVCLDDGEWYWCDVTWDDDGMSDLGYDYQFFCVTDTQDVWYYFLRDGDKYVVNRSESFTDDHYVYWMNSILNMSGCLPDRAETPYDGVDGSLVMRDTFTVDNMTYAITGYRKVQLVDIDQRGDVVIPETVTYEGVTYTVISLGAINPDGTFGSASILNRYVVSLTIPKTVQCIWSDTSALNSMYLKTIVIHPDNPYYRVEKNRVVKIK